MSAGEPPIPDGEVSAPLSATLPVVTSTPLVGDQAASPDAAALPVPVNGPPTPPASAPSAAPSAASSAPAQVTLSGGIEDPSQVRVSALDVGRDRAAAIIAGMLVLCFVLAVFLPAGAEMWGHPLSAEMRSQLDKASTALIGLLGAVIAFYFSDKRLR